MILVKFTLPIVALLSIVSCLQQSNPDAAATTEADDKTVQQRKLLANFSLASILPPVSKISLPKLPSIPKRNTITLTTTVLTQKTQIVKVHPTCMRLHNIQSVCDGILETVIVPTPILPIIPTINLRSTGESDEIDTFSSNDPITPSSTVPIESTNTVEDTSARKNIIEPSEHEYEYTSSSDDSTVELDPSESESRHIKNIIDSILGPKYEIVTKYLTVTKITQVTDYAHTATIIAQNCLPANSKYPLCDIQHIQPLLDRLKNKMTSQTVSKVYDQVDKFVMNNPYGLLGISPDPSVNQFYGALNTDGIPSLLRTAEQFPIYRSMRSTNTTDQN